MSTEGRRPTILDVARESGVSKGTVSRVLNDHAWVSEASRTAVLAAAERLGFVVNASARSLARRRTDALALILGAPAPRLFTDPNYALILQAIAEEVAAADRTLVFLTAAQPAERDRLARFLRAGHVDAAAYLTAGESGTDDFVRLMTAPPIPFMVAGQPFEPDTGIPFVSADEHVGGALLGEHLRERGYRSVGVVTTHLATPGVRTRVEAFTGAVGEAFAPSRLVEVEDYSVDAGRAGLRELLRREPVDAVFATSDVLASGVIAQARERGVRVPADLAVAGYDDSVVATRTDPPLTTVRQDVAALAREIVRRLLGAVDGRPLESVLLPVSLVVRASA